MSDTNDKQAQTQTQATGEPPSTMSRLNDKVFRLEDRLKGLNEDVADVRAQLDNIRLARSYAAAAAKIAAGGAFTMSLNVGGIRLALECVGGMPVKDTLANLMVLVLNTLAVQQAQLKEE